MLRDIYENSSSPLSGKTLPKTPTTSISLIVNPGMYHYIGLGHSVTTTLEAYQYVRNINLVLM